jgi:hypothetical protein
MAEDEKDTIEREIERARDGVGTSIDELDRKLHRTLDLKTFASERAPQLAAGGAVLGFLIGFGFPKPLGRIIKLGMPLMLMAYKVKKSRGNGS